MVLKAGNKVVLKLTDGNDVERDVSAFITKMSMSLKGKELLDVTVMGSEGHIWASDELENCTFTVDFLYDPTADTGIWDVLKSLRTSVEAKAFEIGPQGSEVDDPKITGFCWLGDLPLEATVGDMIKLSGVPFKVDGVVDIDVYSV